MALRVGIQCTVLGRVVARSSVRDRIEARPGLGCQQSDGDGDAAQRIPTVGIVCATWNAVQVLCSFRRIEGSSGLGALIKNVPFKRSPISTSSTRPRPHCPAPVCLVIASIPRVSRESRRFECPIWYSLRDVERRPVLCSFKRIKGGRFGR